MRYRHVPCLHISTRRILLSFSKRAIYLCTISITILVCAWINAFWSPTVFAQNLHAVLVRSDPAEQSVLNISPTSVQLLFSEPVQLVGHAIIILGPTGKPVQHGPLAQIHGTLLRTAVDASKKGTYLVIWQVISQDTDPTSGRFVFSVKNVSGIWTNTSGSGVSPLGIGLQVVARWLHFIGYALGFGPFAFQALILLPLGLAQNEDIKERLLHLVTFGILCLVLAEPIALLAQNASLGAGLLFDPSIIGDVLSSSFGRVLAQRLGAALLLWILVGLVKEGSKRSILIILVLSSVLALIDGEASHAIRSNPVWLGFIANALHIIAMGVWVGGLCTLLVLFQVAEVKNQRAAIIVRFGQIATISVLELGLTGLILALLQLKTPSNLVTTLYGNMLLIKSSLLLLALLLVVFIRHLKTKSTTLWWKLEACLLTAIIVLASLLVSLPPPIA